ncbi:MAG: sugar transferase [Acidimicrobiales bacterium]
MRGTTPSPVRAPRPAPSVAPEAPRSAPAVGPDPASAARSALRPKLILIAADAAALAVSIVVAVAIFERWDPTAAQSSEQLGWAAVVALPVWIALFANQRLYNTRFIGRRIDEFRRIINATLLGTLAVSLVANFANVLLRRSSLVILAVTACLVVTLEREIARRVFLRLRSAGRMVRYVVIAGANPEGRDIAAMLQTEPWLGYEVIGFVDDHAPSREPVPGVPLLGGVADLPGILAEYPNASVIVAASGVESAVTNRLARDLLDQGVHVELSSTLRDISSQRLTVRPLGRFPVVYVEPVTRGGWRAVAKRTFDIVGAAFGLVLTSPIAVVAAVAIKLDSKGPVLFSQTRVGQDSAPFQVLKLRTMVVDAEAAWPSCSSTTKPTARSSRWSTTRASPAWGGSCGPPRSTSCPSCGTCCAAT